MRSSLTAAAAPVLLLLAGACSSSSETAITSARATAARIPGGFASRIADGAGRTIVTSKVAALGSAQSASIEWADHVLTVDWSVTPMPEAASAGAAGGLLFEGRIRGDGADDWFAVDEGSAARFGPFLVRAAAGKLTVERVDGPGAGALVRISPLRASLSIAPAANRLNPASSRFTPQPGGEVSVRTGPENDAAGGCLDFGFRTTDDETVSRLTVNGSAVELGEGVAPAARSEERANVEPRAGSLLDPTVSSLLDGGSASLLNGRCGLIAANHVCKLATAATAVASGVTVSLAVGSGVCIGGTAITIAGELACVLPVGATTLGAIATVFAAGVGFIACSAAEERDPPRAVPRPIPRTRADECKVGADKYCRNLNRRYKAACGQDQFRELTNCGPLRSCSQIGDMIARAAMCKAGRVRFSQDCAGSNVDRGDHRAPIRDANDKLADCIAKYNLPYLACGGSGDEWADGAVNGTMESVYKCE